MMQRIWIATLLVAGAGLAGNLSAQDAPRLSLHELGVFARHVESEDPVPAARGDVSEPPAPAPEPYRFEVRLELGAGTMEHETESSTLDSDTDAGYVRLQFEGFARNGVGGGIRVDGSASDDDMFEDTLGPDITESVSELFLYFAYRFESERFLIPLRTGLALHDVMIEDDGLDEEINFTSIVLRVQVEPELELHQGRALRWTAYTALGLGFGPTEIETDPSTVDDDASVVLFDFDLGTRLQWGPALFGLGYVFRQADIDEGDDFFLGVTNQFSGLMLSLGLRF